MGGSKGDHTDLAPHHRTLIVVIGELPGTADTLLLRLTGAGKTLKRAIAEVKALHPGHPIRSQAERALVAVRLDPRVYCFRGDERHASQLRW